MTPLPRRGTRSLFKTIARGNPVLFRRDSGKNAIQSEEEEP